MVSRRDFFLTCGGAGCALAAGVSASSLLLPSRRAFAASTPRAFPARFWKKLPQKRIECELCPKHCKVEDRERGFCGVRENRDGEYMTLVWGQPCAVHVDPIEKKPLFIFCQAVAPFPSPLRAAIWNANVARTGTFRSRSRKTWISVSCRPRTSYAGPRTTTPA
jgi:anaerobic selenocysteine-containing dehydrogenase